MTGREAAIREVLDFLPDGGGREPSSGALREAEAIVDRVLAAVGYEALRESDAVLVVAAFWATEGESNELVPLVDRRIKDSGSVVTFTPKQAKQPGLMRDLRNFNLTEATEWTGK